MDLKNDLSCARVSKDGGLSLAMDRRRFLLRGVGAGAMAALRGRAFGLMQNNAGAQSDSLLPDGTLFTSWEQQQTIQRHTTWTTSRRRQTTMVREARSVRSRQSTRRRRCCSRASGVIIAAGTYRECVRPERGGTSPEKMISYEAAAGARFTQGFGGAKGWMDPRPNEQFRGGGPGGARRPGNAPPQAL